MSDQTTPPLRGTPPPEGNAHPKDGAQNSPPLEGWQAKPDGVVPKLRFPEFRAAEEWIAMKLNEACDVNPENSELPEEFAYIDLESVEAGELKARKIISRDEAPSRAQRLLRYGDVIFQIVRPYQRNNFHFRIKDDVHYVASTGYAQLRANESADFLFQAVHTDDFVERVIAKCTGSSYPAINSSDLADISIAIPSSGEQQKIADCLASLDERITLEAKKLDTLKAHKKGLMQQLFPAEDEALPKLRFPEFREAGEWESTTFGAAATFINGKAYKQEELLDQGKYRVLRVGNFFTNKEWYFSDLELEEDKYCDSGDLLYAWSASFGPRIWTGEKAIYHYHIWRVIEAKGIDKQFLFVLLDYETERMKAESANGLGLLHITKGAIEGWECCIPKEAEQQKIASCLTSLDDLITAQTQKLAALKTHKKGLMQQLFPSNGGVPRRGGVVEVTGEA